MIPEGVKEAVDVQDFFTQMSKYFEAKWNSSGIRRLRQRINRAVRNGINEFFVFLQTRLMPELVQFCRDNMDLAIKTALEIAQDPEFQNAAGSFKREIAIDRIRDNIGKIEYREHWIGLLVELAVAILKSSKVI